MYTLHPASLPPYGTALSREAAARFALLTAVKEQKLARRHISRRRRASSQRLRPPVEQPAGSDGASSANLVGVN